MPDQVPSAAALTRPFSPSPPRENRHTASRPPSMLFGAPTRGSAITAEASSADVAGLPPTPAIEGQEPPQAGYGYFGPAEEKQGRSGMEDVFGEAIASPRRSSRKVKRGRPEAMNREESSSSDSSSSPPLGAASLLSAIVSTQHIGQTPRSGSPASSLRSRRSDVPTSSSSNHHKSANSGPAAVPAPVPSPQSIPRIHQPTVVRTKSGRGLTFLPPPAELSTSQSSFSPRQPSLSGLSPKSETPPQSTAVAAPVRSPLPRPETQEEQQSPVPVLNRSLSTTSSSVASSTEKAPRKPQSSCEPGPTSHVTVSREDQIAPQAVSEDDEHITLHEISEPESSPKVSFELPTVPASELPDPVEDVRKALHSVETVRIPSANERDPPSKTTGRTYVPPYKVRSKAKKEVYILEDTLGSTEDGAEESRLAITVYASLSRRGSLSAALPERGLELDFMWGRQGWLAWVPGGWLVPQSLAVKRLAGDQIGLATRGREDLGLIRGAVQGVLLRLPVVWRFASWV